METFRVLTAAEQVGEYLRAELCRGAWGGRMPGGSRLATELGVGRDTVEAALRILERDRLLVPQGAGRRRRIDLPEGIVARPMRVAILVTDRFSEGYMIELFHLLVQAGHQPFHATKTLVELGMDVGRVARLVKRTEADAWLVVSGSREILEWFSRQSKPTFALFGRRGQVSIAAAGPDKAPLFAAATGRLIELGHRRISLVCRRQRRLPQPGQPERAFLHELAAHGIPTGDFNLPDWEESKKGFVMLLDSLFGTTPPTALILDESFLFNAAFHYLAKRGLPDIHNRLPVLHVAAGPQGVSGDAGGAAVVRLQQVHGAPCVVSAVVDPRVLAIGRRRAQEPAVGRRLQQAGVVPLAGVVGDRVDIDQVVERHLEGLLDDHHRRRGAGELQRRPGFPGGHRGEDAQKALHSLTGCFESVQGRL